MPINQAADEKLLAFIKKYSKKHGYAPTTREMATALGITSPGAVHKRLVRLRRAGRVTWRDNATRTITVAADG